MNDSEEGYPQECVLLYGFVAEWKGKRTGGERTDGKMEVAALIARRPKLAGSEKISHSGPLVEKTKLDLASAWNHGQQWAIQ